MSRYSSFGVRTIVFVAGEIFFEKIAAMMLISSREVQAIRSRSLDDPGVSEKRLATAPPTMPTS